MQQAAEIGAEFRANLEDYFRALEEWEQAYGRFYRIASPNRVSPDLVAEYKRFAEAKRILKQSMPKAQALCHRYHVRENWSGLLLVELHSVSPQSGPASPIGKSERSLAMAALAELELSIRSGEASPEKAPRRKRGLVSLFLDLFQSA